MYCRLRYELRPFGLRSGGDTLSVLDRAGRPVTMTFGTAKALGVRTDALGVCQALCECMPRPEVLDALNAMVGGVAPAGMALDDAEALVAFLRTNPLHGSVDAVPSLLVPEAVNRFASQIVTDLREAAWRATRLLMWRYALGHATYPLGTLGRGAEFSFDGDVWYLLPLATEWRFRAVPTLRVDRSVERELQELLERSGAAPIAFELLWEARDLCDQNPRSALLVGVSALEIGVKQFLVARLPEARWLVEHLQSPPVKRLLVEFLPQVDSAIHGDQKCAVPPPEAIQQIEQAVGARNRLIHVTGKAPASETVARWLDYIESVLRHLDWQLGYQWAEGLIAKHEAGLEEGAA